MFQNIISSHQCFYSSVNNVSGALPWTPCRGRPAVDTLPWTLCCVLGVREAAAVC